MRARTVITIALLLSLLAACGGSEDGSATTDPDTSTSDDGGGTRPPTTVPAGVSGDVLLTVAYQGGFLPVEVALASGYAHVLTADGSLISEGPIPEIYPAPLLRPYGVVDVSGDMDTLTGLIDALGIADVTDETIEGDAFIADAPSTVVVYHDENGAHRMSAQALFGDPETSDPRLAAMLDLVMTLDSFASDPGSQPYQVEQWQVLATAPMETGDIIADPAPWPLDIAPGDFEAEVAGLPCTVVDNTPEIEAAFTEASQLTAWTDGSDEYGLVVRPLLPGEHGCEQS